MYKSEIKYLLATVNIIELVDSTGDVMVPIEQLTRPLLASVTLSIVAPHWPNSRPSPLYDIPLVLGISGLKCSPCVPGIATRQ